RRDEGVRRPPARLKLVARQAGALVFVVARQGGVSEAEAREAIAHGGVFLRGKRMREPEVEVGAGDRIEVALRRPPPLELSRERVLHLDPLLLAVDKPPGVSAQEDLEGGIALPGC